MKPTVIKITSPFGKQKYLMVNRIISFSADNGYPNRSFIVYSTGADSHENEATLESVEQIRAMIEGETSER